MIGKLIIIQYPPEGLFPNGVTGKKCTAFFTARGAIIPTERGLGKNDR